MNDYLKKSHEKFSNLFSDQEILRVKRLKDLEHNEIIDNFLTIETSAQSINFHKNGAALHVTIGNYLEIDSFDLFSLYGALKYVNQCAFKQNIIKEFRLCVLKDYNQIIGLVLRFENEEMSLLFLDDEIVFQMHRLSKPLYNDVIEYFNLSYGGDILFV